MAKNRLLAAKNDKAKGERAAAFGALLLKEAAYNPPRMSDQQALVCAIARRADVTSVGGRAIRVMPDGVTSKNVMVKAPACATTPIISAHW